MTDHPPMNYEHGLGGDLLAVWTAVFQRQRAYAEHAMGQLDDEAFFRSPAPTINSVGVIAQHVGGNLISRWTDFLTTDGEKPDRHRDREFVVGEPNGQERARIMQRWDQGWLSLLDSLGRLTPEDLGRTVTIRTKPHTVHAAIARSMDHTAGHVGQIQIIARWAVGAERWEWFTIEPGGTEAFNRRLMGG